MATSLMNGISYCRETCWDLIEAGSVLLSDAELDEKAAMRSIALDEHEIIEIMSLARSAISLHFFLSHGSPFVTARRSPPAPRPAL
jgi:hypothetical protein